MPGSGAWNDTVRQRDEPPPVAVIATTAPTTTTTSTATAVVIGKPGRRPRGASCMVGIRASTAVTPSQCLQISVGLCVILVAHVIAAAIIIPPLTPRLSAGTTTRPVSSRATPRVTLAAPTRPRVVREDERPE